MRPLSSGVRKSLTESIARYTSNLDQAEQFLLGRGITLEAAAQASLGVVVDPAPGHEAATGRLAIPYFDATGPTTIRFRSLDGSEPKYWSMPNDPVRLYNTGALLKADYVAITEGELDALVLDLVVGVPAVGIPGSGQWKDHWVHCFAGFNRVDLFIDNDDAGNKLASRCEKEIPGAQRVYLPAGMDVNDTFLAHGAEWFW